MNIGHIAGGTNAGWRKTKNRAADWTCPVCSKRLKHFWVKCPNDGSPRPDPEEG